MSWRADAIDATLNKHPDNEWWFAMAQQMIYAVDKKLIPAVRVGKWDKTDYLVMADLLEDNDLPLAAEWLRAIGEARR